jgi:hypothetical protein
MGEVWDGNSLANPLLNLVRDDPSTQRHNITRLKSYSQPKVGEENITTLMFPKCKEEGPSKRRVLRVGMQTGLPVVENLPAFINKRVD